jgi:hypothetical protein
MDRDATQTLWGGPGFGRHEFVANSRQTPRSAGGIQHAFGEMAFAAVADS